jgi:hypothetical protein
MLGSYEMCQCYKIGGPFIAEDPDCPAHGTEAQACAIERESERDQITFMAEQAMLSGTAVEIRQALASAVRYLHTL